MPQIRLEPSSRHPIVLLMLALLIVSSISIAFGAPAPGSIEEALPQWGVRIWAASLFSGSVCILIGLKLQTYLGMRSVTGALLEKVGMAMLAAPGILYGIAALVAIKWAALIPAGLIFGLSGACGYRWWTIRKQVKAYLDRKARETAQDGER